MRITTKFDIGAVCYLKTDPEQYPCIITGILVKPEDLVMYEVSSYDDISYRYEFELTTEKDVLLKMH